MIVLGISGLFHDAAAALVVDGAVVAAAQEERFTRVKHDARLPVSSVAACLDVAGLRASDIDRVVFYEKPISAFARSLTSALQVAPAGFGQFRRAVPSYLGEKIWVERAVARMLRGLGGRLTTPLLFTEHHQAHAASAFYPSPFDSAAVVTMDGVGEWATTTIGHGTAAGVRPLRQLRYPHSIGLLYSAVTQFCGFRVNGGESKLMGLAPYGEPRYRDLILRELLDLRPDGSFHLRAGAFGFLTGTSMTGRRFAEIVGGPARRPEEAITRREADLARSVQDVTEEVVLRIASTALDLTGERRLCLAGGVALNAVANGRLLRGPAEEVWVQPAAGDAGGALGAALEGWHRLDASAERRAPSPDGMSGCLLGPSFDDESVRAALDRCGVPSVPLAAGERAHHVARLLAAGDVVGMFDGPMEFGPRALGSRSILADPRSPDVVARINGMVKQREGFRPFAPAVLEEAAEDWFEIDRPLPYMTFVVPVAEHRLRDTDGPAWPPEVRLAQVRSDIGAVTHVDGTARVQTVSAGTTPRFHAVLAAFAELTGCPVLLNTSLNVRGEPIVCTPDDALAMFARGDLEHLVLGDRLVSRRAAATVGHPVR